MVASRFALGALEALASGATDEMVAWQSPLEGGVPTRDRSVTRWPLARVLDETAALLDGRSPVTQQRVAMMQRVAGVLSI
jgi:6-phosphofructokinase 1